MKTITIKIDVKNCEEIVKKKKGAFYQFLSSIMVSKDKIKKTIEDKVYEDIAYQLRKHLPDQLAKKDIEAKVIVKIVEDKPL